MGAVSRKWRVLSNDPGLWSHFLTLPNLPRLNPRMVYIRHVLRHRYIFALDGYKLLRIDLLTHAASIDKVLAYHPDLLRLSNGSLFFCGGWCQEGPRTKLKCDVCIYDPMTQGIEMLAELAEEKTSLALVEQDCMVYAFGGARKGAFVRSADRYLVNSFEKEVLPSLPWEMRSIAATQYSGQIYLCHTPNLSVARYSPTTSVYEHLLTLTDRTFAQVLLSIQYHHFWIVLLSRNSQILDLSQSRLTDIRITAKSSPKKYLSPVQAYNQSMYFLGRTEHSIAIWQVKVHGNSAISLVLAGSVA